MPHTPGPWKYRPQEYDDWGWVRATAADGESWLVAMARSGDYTTEEQLDEHRRNKTDPYEANARLIAASPDLYEYVKSSASAGCATAKLLVEKINSKSEARQLAR